MIRSHHVNFWPALVDIVVTTLMVIVLSLYIQVLGSFENEETLSMELSKERFVVELEKAFGTNRANHEMDWSWDPGKFLKIAYSDRVLFVTCSYTIQPDGQALLGRQAEMLASSVGMANLREVQVEGHTDNAVIQRWCNKDCPDNSIIACWRPKDNFELSSARAISVVNLLQKQSGLDGSLFSANAYGDHHPINRDNSVLNRRIEVKIFFKPQTSEAP